MSATDASPGATPTPADLAAHFAARLAAETDPTDVYAAQRAGLAFARLGYRVREMIGGFEYWAREGYPVEDDSGRVSFVPDPTVSVVR